MDTVTFVFYLSIKIANYIVIVALPAHLARKKGRCFNSWGLYGYVFFPLPVALIHSLFIKPMPVSDEVLSGKVKNIFE